MNSIAFSTCRIPSELTFLLTRRLGGCEMGLGFMAGATNRPYRVVIRRAGDGLFLKSEDEWTQDARSARVFKQSGDAAVFAAQRGLRGVEIIMAHNTPAYDFVLVRL